MSSCPSLALLFLIEFVPNNLKTSSHMYLEKKSFLNLVLLLILFFSHRGSLWVSKIKQVKASWGLGM